MPLRQRRRKGGVPLEIPTICRYCGGAVRLVSASKVYGPAAAARLGIERQSFYQCQNCNARVGCHPGSTRPLGNLANEALRMKRMETHHVFDSFWKERGMSRTQAYISLIDKREAEVLMLLYSEKESAVNVAERLGYSKRTITRIHNAAVAHLAEMYEYAEKYDG